MKRFIDLKFQTGNVEKEDNGREFAFYCTISDKFEIFNGKQTWETEKEFIEDCKMSSGLSNEEISRFTNLIPLDYFKRKISKKRHWVVFQMQASELKWEKVYFTKHKTNDEINEYFEDSCGGVYKWWRLEDVDSAINCFKQSFYVKLFEKLGFLFQVNKCDNAEIRKYQEEVKSKVENLKNK